MNLGVDTVTPPRTRSVFAGLAQKRSMSFLIAALVFGATCYSYYQPYHSQPLCGTGYESLQLACSLAQKGTFSNPFRSMPTGPSAHLSPLYPALVAFLVRCFGEETGAGLAMGWAAMTVVGLHLALLPFLSRRFNLGFSTGVVAAAIFLLAKIPLFVMWESFYVALLTIVLSWLMYEIVTGKPSVAKVIVTAFLWGILLWTAVVPVLILLAWLAWVFIATKLPRSQKLTLLILPFLIISPWLVRNYRTFGHFVFMRDSLGLELATSNNPCATLWLKLNEATGCFASNHPNDGFEQAQRLLQLGEYQYNQQRMHEALEWIHANPGRFATLTGWRIVLFWFPSGTPNPFAAVGTPLGFLVVWFMSLLSLPGIWLMWRKNREATAVILLWLLLFPPIYYVVQFDLRYRHPILWATFLPAAFFIVEMAKGVWSALRSKS